MLYLPLWLIEGIFVGIGAILPGVSGGTLCAAFGMYRPIIECLSDPFEGIRHHGGKLLCFALGIAAGFIGFSGLTAKLLAHNAVYVTSVFIGFLLGTFPSMWRDAGKEGRNRTSFATLAGCFLGMAALLLVLKNVSQIQLQPNGFGFFLCGVFWGGSLVIPGLSSSSLLLFFGLYAPMLEGIAALQIGVLLPMLCGLLLCVLLFSRLISRAYAKHYSQLSHGVLGTVLATTILILPPLKDLLDVFPIFCILLGGICSFLLTGVMERVEKRI